MFDASTYEAHETTIEPGDTLVLYSDGVTEAENHTGQPFEESGLERVVDGHAVRRARPTSPQAILRSRRSPRPGNLSGRRRDRARGEEEGRREPAPAPILTSGARRCFVVPRGAGEPRPSHRPAARSRTRSPSLLGRLEQVLRRRRPGTLPRPAARRPPTGRRPASFAQAVAHPRCHPRRRPRARPRASAGHAPRRRLPLLVEVFLESGQRARRHHLAPRRPAARHRPVGDWGIVSQEIADDAAGLYRLSLNPKRQVAAKDLVVSAEDLTLTVPDGDDVRRGDGRRARPRAVDPRAGAR